MDESETMTFEAYYHLSRLTIRLEGRPLCAAPGHAREIPLVAIEANGVTAGYNSRQHDSALTAKMDSLELTDLLSSECLARSFDTAPGTTNQLKPLVNLKYAVCAEQSAAFTGVATKLTLQISDLYFFLTRPVVASLIQVRAPFDPVSRIVGRPSLVTIDVTVRCVLQFNSDLVEESRFRAQTSAIYKEVAEAGSSSGVEDFGPLEIDRDRVSFHMLLEVQRIDLHMKLEDSSTLGSICATALKVCAASLHRM